MTWFKKKTKIQDALYYVLDDKLYYARKKKENSFFYPLKDDEINKAMSWGIRNRVGIQLDHVTDGKNYYKFFGFSLDS